jgi:hypothetical protein
MPRLWFVGALAAAAFGGWYFLKHYEIEGIESLHVEPRAGEAGDATGLDDGGIEQPPVPEGHNTIRIATVNLNPFDQRKASKPHVVDRLAQVIRRFDVVAIQGVRARDQGILLEFVEAINAEERHYDFATPPSLGQEDVEQYSAFLFDRSTVEIDRSTVCVVDGEGRFRREPLVASFRARGPSAEEAFTFTLVNVHTDPSRAVAEVDLLADVYRAVRDDGRGEDDVLVLGDLGADLLASCGADGRHLGALGQVPDIACAVSDVPSTTRGTRLVDNVLFGRRATSEFTGRSGVVDLIREFDLSMRQAVEISDHLPIWAEFSVYEGGQAGHVAQDPENPPR